MNCARLDPTSHTGSAESRWSTKRLDRGKGGVHTLDALAFIGEEGGITVRAILEPLKSCPADACAVEMRRHLERLDFDLAGVQENPGSSVIGYVRRTELQNGVVRDHVRRFSIADLIADSTPLAESLWVLRDRTHAFVLMGPEVRAIVTVADLNKPPVRIYLFGLISLLEMHLTYWTRRYYTEQAWINVLNGKRLDKARHLLKLRQGKNQELSLLDCLQFCDKRELVLASDDARRALGVDDRESGAELLRRAEEVRNNLAHSQEELVADGSSIGVTQVAERIESMLEHSDSAVESDAGAEAEEFEEQLLSAPLRGSRHVV